MDAAAAALTHIPQEGSGSVSSHEYSEAVHPAPGEIAAKSWWARSRAWISILLLVPAGVLAAVSPPHVPFGSCSELGYEAAGWSLFVLGAFARWWATLYIGGRKGNQLILEGPYSISRNPLYFGTFLIVMSIAVMIQSLLFALAALTASALYLSVTVPDEQRRLQRRHGQAFDDYRRRVPVFFPMIHLYCSTDTVPVRVDGLRAELNRTLRWIWVPFLCHAFMHLRAQDWWPHLWNLP